jgi:hypothetical protein
LERDEDAELHLDLPEKVGKQIVRLITADSDAI